METMTTAFLDRPDVSKVAAELKGLWDLDRVWAAVDGERICGTYRSWPTEMTVPGGAQLPAGAVSAVSVLPTHRRQGVLRAMTAAEHAGMRERGEVFGLLFAAEYGIYGRFGYGVGTRPATWTLDTHRTGFLLGTTSGIELLTPKEARETITSVFEAWRMQSVGEIRRIDYRWDFDLGIRDRAWGKPWRGFVIVHRDAAGNADGYALYRAEEKWEQGQPRNTLNVDALHALNDDAYAALWRFLAEVDWVATVKAEGRFLSERLPWLLTNARAAAPSDVSDGLWVRIFDAPRALEARTYERSGSLVLEVIDAEAAGGRVRVHLDAGPDGARATLTNRSADLSIDIGALGAAYLGGTRLRDAVLAAGFDEHRRGALAKADALLRTADEPWCSTYF